MTIPVELAELMDADTYQRQALRTWNRDYSPEVATRLAQNAGLVNAALGAAGEAGEFADHLKKHIFQGHPLDRALLAKEIGDQAYYLAVGAYELGLSFGSTLRGNIYKLLQRFPLGFSEADSLARVDVEK